MTTTDVRRCTDCGTAQRLHRRTRGYPESGLDNVELQNAPIWICENGHEELQVPAITQLHDLLAQLIIRKPAPLSGQEIRFLRKRLGMPAIEFAPKLGLHHVSLSRFENNQRQPTRRLDLLIRLGCAALIAERDDQAFPADLGPLVNDLEASWSELGQHQVRHDETSPPEHEWEPVEAES